jgi:hypothetical protein
MTIPAIILRREELRRRVDALPAEVSAWQTRCRKELDMNAHASQIDAIGVIMEELLVGQRALLAALDDNPATFGGGAFALIGEIIRAQSIWGYFRSKLDQRFSPDFKDQLWVADTVAWNCYRPVLDEAVIRGLLKPHELREPPLAHLTAQYSAATWVRGTRPFDGRDYELGTSRLPIPIIELPWDQVSNLWELVSIQHEVAHDIEADLKLRPALRASLETALSQKKADAKAIEMWSAWQPEVFADLVALRLGGPAFAEALLGILILSPDVVTTYDPNDPHPTHYPRVLMNCAYIRKLVPGNPTLAAHADAIEATWTSIYGGVTGFDAMISDFEAVFTALMDTPFPELSNARVRELVPYNAKMDKQIREAADYLRTGQNAPPARSVLPRHCVSAARLAVSAMTSTAGPEMKTALQTINERTVKLVRDSAAPGLRGGEPGTKHRKFVASLVKDIDTKRLGMTEGTPS